MAVKVYVPTPFRRLTGDRTFVEAEGHDVAAVLHDLAQRFPALRELLVPPDPQIPAPITVYLNSREVSTLQGPETKVADGDEIALIPRHCRRRRPHARASRPLQPASHHGSGRAAGAAQTAQPGRVLAVGAGGLGSPVLMYLAAVGVGVIGIVDFDVVDLSTLQRQIIHGTSDLGRPKVDSAADRIRDLNPHVTVVKQYGPLTSENAMEVISQYDIVVNGADNFATRYLVNDACYFARKPLVDGSIFLFEGQVTTFIPGSGCYRCLYPSPPPPGMVPSCAEAGVLGVLPGTIGGIQATEVMKLILGLGEPLKNRLLLYDALAMEFRTVKIRLDPQLPRLRRRPHGDGTHRLRGVLRFALP